MESWSDARAYDGTVTIIQPLIAPIYRGKSPHEVRAALTDQPERSSYEIVREYWRNRLTGAGSRGPAGKDKGAGAGVPGEGERADDFETFWRKALHDGLVPGTALPARTVPMRTGWQNRAAEGAGPLPQGPGSLMEIIFRPDPTIYDGRFANSGWLQELPKPLTKLTWDNAALVSPAAARRLGLSQRVSVRGGEHGAVDVDVVELEYRGRKVRAPVWILPGQPDDCVTVHLGYGRRRAGRVGSNAGFDAYLLRTSDSPWFGPGLRVTKTGERF